MGCDMVDAALYYPPMRFIRRLLTVLVLFITVGLPVGSTSSPASATLTNCARYYSGGKITQICYGYSSYPNPTHDEQAIYVKCDGRWPISDYYAYSNWAGRNQSAVVNCGSYRQPRYQWTVQR